MHFKTIPRPHDVSPPNLPPRPQLSLSLASTAAFASRSRWTTESWPSWAATCSGVWPREPQSGASHRQNPTKRRGENSDKILGTSKVEVLEIVATQKSSLNFRNIVVLSRGCFDDIELVEKSHVNQVGSQNALRKLREQICVRLGHNRI